MSRSNPMKMVLAVFVGAAFTIAGATQAAADEPAKAPEQHCIESADTGDTACYNSLDQAISAVTGHSVKLTATTATDKANELSKVLGSVSPQVNVVQAILWTSTGLSGSSLTLYSTFLCGTTGTATWTYFQPPWNNNLESGQTFAGCRLRLYDGNLATGSPSYLIPADSTVTSFSSFNNQASSARSCGSSLSCT